MLEQSSDTFYFRFGGVGRLYGVKVLESFRHSRVLVVGLGGVGSWAAEALVRAGVGHIRLVDPDEVCLSNVNRQLMASDQTVGRLKVQALKERFQSINTDCQVETIENFFTETSCDSILNGHWDCVLDCMDGVKNKIALAAACRVRSFPLVVSGSAGGRTDPTQVRVTDLARTKGDPMLARLRKILRKDHGWPRSLRRSLGVACVWSEEPPLFPQSDGCVSELREDDGPLALDCASGLGSVAHLTGTFGFFAAHEVLKVLRPIDVVGAKQ